MKTHKLSPERKLRSSSAVALVCSLLLSNALANTTGTSIGLKFAPTDPNYATSGLNAGDSAGVVPSLNWNNLTNASGSFSAVVADSSGSSLATPVAVTWFAPNTYRSGANNAFPVGSDKKLMSGYLDGGNTTANGVFITVSNLPASFTLAGYEVYVYFLGDSGADRGGGYTITNQTGFVRKYGSTMATPSSFVQDAGTDSNNSLDGTYLRFTTLSGNWFTLKTDTTLTSPNGFRAPVNAVEIVALPCTTAGITTQPVTTTACSGSTVQLSVSATGSLPTYQWRKSGVNLINGPTGNGSTVSGATAATLTINSAAVADTAEAGSGYDCVITAACDSSTTNSTRVALTVNPAAAVFSVKGGGSDCSGAGVAVGLSGSETGVDYRLRTNGVFNGVVVAGTGSALSLGFQSLNGTYTVFASNTLGGCTALMSGSAVVAVTAATITVQPTNRTVCSGSSVSFSVSATGATTPIYRWRKNGVNLVNGPTGNGSTITGATNATLTINPATAADAADSLTGYDCVISAPCETNSTRVALVVNPSPAVFVATGGGSDCSGTGVPVGLSSSEIGVDYWLRTNGVFSGVILAGTGSPLAFGNQTFSRTYTIQASNTAGGCTLLMGGSAVVVTSVPVITLQPTNRTVCGNASVSFSVGVTASTTPTYQWRKNGVNLANGPTGNGSTISGATTNTLTINPVAAGDAADSLTGYDCVISAPCETNSARVALVVNPSPTVFAVTGGSGCSSTGVPVGLSGSETGVDYRLRTNGVFNGVVVAGTGSTLSFGNQNLSRTYTIQASNTFGGCTALMSGSASVTDGIPPVITSGSNPATFTNYQGGYLSFSVTATGSPLNYQWRRDGTNLTNGGRISGATSPTLTISSADPADSVGVGHGYTCMVSSCGPVFSAESTATIIPFVAVPETLVGVWTNRYNGPATSADTVTGMAIDGDGNVIVTGYSDDKITASDMITVKYSSAGAPLWTNRYNGPANRDDKAVALALDSSGNVAVTGSSHNGTNDDYYTAKYAAVDGSLLWEKRYNGPTNLTDLPKAVAIDSSGNVIVTGSSQRASFNEDYYTAKYAAVDGALLWEKRYDGPISRGDVATAVAVDTNGNVVVTGYSRNLANNDDYYIAKYAVADGALLWEQRYNGPANGMDKANAITVDSMGNVIVTGQSPNGSNDDIYTVKYAATDGSLVWERRYASAGPFSGSDGGLAVTVDGGGNVVVAGYSTGASADFYTAKYAAADGSLIWEHTYNGPFNHVDFANDVAVDANGDVIVVGKSGNGGTGGTGAAWDNIYTAKYAAADGALLWQKIYDGPANGADVGISVAVDGSGNVTIAGYSSHDGSKNDYYTARYAAADGTLIWEQRLDRPGNDSDIAFAVAVDASGNAAVTGYSSVSGFRTWRTVKYAADGALLWVAFNTNSSSEGKVIAMDQSGNVIVSGTVMNGFSDDYYTAKYAAADGALLWARQYNGPAARRDLPTALAVDGNGNVIVTGSSQSAIWEDYYTAKYAAVDGALLWEVRYNGPANFEDIPRAVGLDAGGNVIVTGSSGDSYTAKYAAADGSLLWEKQSLSGGLDLAVDSLGNVIITGGSTTKYDGVDGSVLWERGSPAGVGGSVAVDGGGNVLVMKLVTDNYVTYDFYTAKYSSTDGALLWEKRGPSAGNNLNQHGPVAVDGSGNVVVAGYSYNGSNYDLYTMKVAGENGTLLWSVRYNGPANGDDEWLTRNSLAIGPAGEVIIAGWSDGDYTTGVTPDYVTIKYTSGNGNANTHPIVASPLPDTNGVYGTPFNFTFATSTFTDSDAGQTLNYSAAGLPDGFTFNPATRSFSGTPTNVGTISVTVTATDNGSPTLSTNDVFDIVIAKAPLTAAADNKSRTYALANPPLTISYSGFVLGETAADVDTPPIPGTPATSGSSVGPYPITIGGGADDHYEFSYVSATLSVTPSALSVSADNTNRAYGTVNPSFTGALVGVAHGDNITLIFSSLAETNSPVGNYAITAGLVDPDTKLGNYVVTTNNGTLTVTAAALTVTANDTNRVYGAANPDFTGSIVGIANGDNLSTAFSTTADANSPLGTYPITPALVDPDTKLGNYIVTTNNGTLTVTAAALTVTANDTNRIYGTANPDFTGSLLGVVNNDNITATFSTTATIADPPGSYPITPALSDPDGKLSNYAATTNNGTLTITSPPVISYTLGGGGGGLFTLSWPADVGDFLLECTASVTPPLVWQPLTNGIMLNGGMKSYTVTNDLGLPGRFYRLRLP